MVGENSTGKTSFLALIRSLWDLAVEDRLPDFKESPYDLGSFYEIVYSRGKPPDKDATFQAGCAFGPASDRDNHHSDHNAISLRYSFTFRREGSDAIPSSRQVVDGPARLECTTDERGVVTAELGTSRGQWKYTSKDADELKRFAATAEWEGGRELFPLNLLIHTLRESFKLDVEPRQDVNGSRRRLERQDLAELNRIRVSLRWHTPRLIRPFSGAPVRSQPQRTYDPGQAVSSPEGDNVPRLLASIAHSNPEEWMSFKGSMEEFGRDAGLFDRMRIRELGDMPGGPFQVEVKPLGESIQGSYRNIIDVGYGVSQALPLVTELLLRRPAESLRSQLPTARQMLLLQQPEIHLHPSAQAALGGFLAKTAQGGDQPIVVETHSDHLIDRIRMDVRDGRAGLSPEDVTILYFERKRHSVSISSLGWDSDGNLVASDGSIPESYREFFRLERRRSLGL